MKKPERPPSSEISKDETNDLITLLGNKELLDKVFEVEKDYPYWERFKHKTKEFYSDPKFLWKFIKLQRKRNISNINLCDVNGFKFKYNISEKTLKRLHQFDLNLGGILEGGSIVPEREKERFMISSLMEEAIASSQ